MISTIQKIVEFYNLGDYMIKRNKYLNQLISAQKNGFPKIITGIRRCGKSYLLKEIYRECLVNSGVQEKNILIMELDDEITNHLCCGQGTPPLTEPAGNACQVLSTVKMIGTAKWHTVA